MYGYVVVYRTAVGFRATASVPTRRDAYRNLAWMKSNNPQLEASVFLVALGPGGRMRR